MPETDSESTGILDEIVRVYRRSRKTHDIAWNLYVARPLAAVLVSILRRTPITPNQTTIVGAAVFLGAAALLIFMRNWTGLLLAAAVLEFAYIIDCADGQLARLKGMTSEIGAYFDFLIDEFKALFLVGAMSIRLWLEQGHDWWLLVGIGGCVVVSLATSLTNFIRRPEYAGEEVRPGASAKQPGMPNGVVPKVQWLLQRTASYLVHYPSWFVFIALADGLPQFNGAEWFLYLFLGVYILYLGRTGLAVTLKLGRPGFYER